MNSFNFGSGSFVLPICALKSMWVNTPPNAIGFLFCNSCRAVLRPLPISVDRFFMVSHLDAFGTKKVCE